MAASYTVVFAPEAAAEVTAITAWWHKNRQAAPGCLALKPDHRPRRQPESPGIQLDEPAARLRRHLARRRPGRAHPRRQPRGELLEVELAASAVIDLAALAQAFWRRGR